jgi:hypothetical protein
MLSSEPPFVEGQTLIGQRSVLVADPAKYFGTATKKIKQTLDSSSCDLNNQLVKQC